MHRSSAGYPRGNFRKSYISSAQSGQIMGFRKINTTFAGLQKHNLFTSCFIIEKNAWTTLFGARGGEPYYAYSAEARPNENVCAALSERLPSDYLRIRRRSDISGNIIVRKDTVCHVRIIN